MNQGKSTSQTEFSEAVIIIALFAFFAGSAVLMLQAWGIIPLTFK